MIAQIFSVVAFAITVNGKNLQTDYEAKSRQVLTDNLYSGDVIANISTIVEIGKTKIDNIYTIGDTIPKEKDYLSSYCNKLPSMNNTLLDNTITMWCNDRINDKEYENHTKYYQTDIRFLNLEDSSWDSIDMYVIGFATGTLNGNITIAYSYARISTTLFPLDENCCCCEIGSCSNFMFHMRCKYPPTLEQLDDIQEYLESTLRKKFEKN